AIADAVGGFGSEELGDGCFSGEGSTVAFRACRSKAEQARRVELHLAVGDEPLDGLKIGDRAIELPAVFRVASRFFERGRGDARRLRADADAPSIERGHGHGETLVELAEQRALR